MPNLLNTLQLPPRWEADSALIEKWRSGAFVRRLWEGDASVWTDSDESKWVAWLDIAEQQLARPDQLIELKRDIGQAGFTDILLLGMGGSSLCPDVLSRTFGQQEGFPKLHVLDSTDPAQVLATERKVDLAKTLFFVSSKSGTTLEPDIMRRHFFERAGAVLGGAPGAHFIAVTDPGSELESIADRDGYRKILYGLKEIGGRYSALSNFGMAPAAAAGLDALDFLKRAQQMAEACKKDDPAENPGASLGLLLGGYANAGKNKLTLVVSKELESLGAWLEQLVAESTGKLGKAIIPVDMESLGAPEVYGADRVFVQIGLGADRPSDRALQTLEQAGHPVVRIQCLEAANLGQEFFRWEFATAVAGSVMGINPFNQPDVEASKIASRKLTEEFEKTKSLPAEAPFFENDGVKLFADKSYAATLAQAADTPTLVGYLRAHLDQIGANDYVALLGYIEMNDAHEQALQAVRMKIRDAKKTATCLGFGPRFLHSTGQAYKGGPNQGVVVQITCDDANDVAVPGRDYSFGIVKAAQARGDFTVLEERKRRALRVHLSDVEAGLKRLAAAIGQALV
ncbi:MAG: bifunctional transaldolase/phosoglucose isomerase [Acidobacteria bacterium]|nr:bifunctional transaldolase/phosoglucose isomerase [Acidobacteriota bacterium]MDA1236591.1 bifunctional transaldolase/phosoglucose isomerase [Acidobacteriota bacterium]